MKENALQKYRSYNINWLEIVGGIAKLHWRSS